MLADQSSLAIDAPVAGADVALPIEASRKQAACPACGCWRVGWSPRGEADGLCILLHLCSTTVASYTCGMPRQPTAARRARVLRWHEEHPGPVAETCRRFGIDRSTFYRWRARYDPALGARSLKPRSRRPHRTRQPQWTERDLARVADLALRFPFYGKRRLHHVLADDGAELSEATVGRLLALVRARCPICGRRGGRHLEMAHAFRHDLGWFDPSKAHLRPGTRTRPGRAPKPDLDQLPARDQVVRSAEKLLRRPKS